MFPLSVWVPVGAFSYCLRLSRVHVVLRLCCSLSLALSFFFLSSVQMWSRTEVMCLIQCVLLTRESLRAVLMYSAGVPVWIQVPAVIGCLGNGAQRRKCELWPAVAESYPAGGRSGERQAGRRLRVARPTWPLQAALWSITRSASHHTSVFLPPTGTTNPSKPSSFPFSSLS